jgi:hypothetical protein
VGDITSAVPNPGSDEAVAKGCTCPVWDNTRGRGIATSTGLAFWISDKCPVHFASQPAALTKDTPENG